MIAAEIPRFLAIDIFPSNSTLVLDIHKICTLYYRGNLLLLKFLKMTDHRQSIKK